MKKLIAAVFLIFCCSNLTGNGGWTVCNSYFSELYVFEGGWIMELYIPRCQGGLIRVHPINYQMSLDGYSISTLSGESEFVPGLTIYSSQPLLIDQSDLMSPLTINPEGDIISFYWDDYLLERVAFGNVSNPDVSAPFGYQSMVSLSWGYYGEDYHFIAKEAPPTLGSNPYEVLSRGTIKGVVFDINENPKPNAHLYFRDYYNYDWVYFTALTNPDGYFSVSDVLAHLYSNTMIEYDGEWYGPFPVAVEPDTTSYVEIHTITTGLGSKIPQTAASPPWFYNYPNPVSSYTIFSITLPEKIGFSSATISIINPNGQLIDKILVEGSPGASQQVYWDASSIASGIYLFTLEVDDRFVASNKMTVLR